jgi:hypothetical protein
VLFNVEPLNGKEVGQKKSIKTIEVIFKNLAMGLKCLKSNNPSSLVIALNTKSKYES